MAFGDISESSPRHIIVQEIEREEQFGNKHETQDTALLVSTPEIQPVMDPVHERDYDVEPTNLYTALQKKRWSDALAILEQSPEEARTWVYRKESNGPNLRWRLLPIHGAVIFQAPAEVVESILLIYPESAAERDDEGSLPIHLAYKRAAPTAVCKLLLDAFPNSIDIADRKGRTPKHLAASSNGPKHREFVFAMKNHLLSLRAARVSVRSEERLRYSVKLDELKKAHEQELANLEKRKSNDIAFLERQISELENELRRTQEASQVLVAHVTSMEAKIAQYEVTENDMKTKVEALEVNLESVIREKKEKEAIMKEDVNRLNQQLLDIQDHVNHLLLEKEALNKSLDQVVSGAELEKKALEEALAAKELEISKLKSENEKSYNECETLKAEVAEKVASIDSMTKTIQLLESELQQEKDSAASAARAAQDRLAELETDRLELRMTVATLTKKLRTVAGFLDDMTSEQDAIIEQADEHEAEMQASQQEHARILEEVSKQEELDAKAQEARDIIFDMITMHQDSYARSTIHRKKIVGSIDDHCKNLAEGSVRRKELVKNVKTLQEKIRRTRERVLGGLPDLEGKAGEFSILSGYDPVEESRCPTEEETMVNEGRQESLDFGEAGSGREHNTEVREGSEMFFKLPPVKSPRRKQQQGKVFEDEKKEPGDEAAVGTRG